MDGDGMGWRFWAGLVGMTLALALGGFIAFALIGWAWYAWGLFGAFVLFGVLAAVAGWIFDRREARRRRVAV